MSRRVAANFLTMGLDELEQVPLQERAVLPMLRGFLGRRQGSQAPTLLALYSDKDNWAPATDALWLEREVPEADIAVLPGLPHAFTLQGPRPIETVVATVKRHLINARELRSGPVRGHPRARL